MKLQKQKTDYKRNYHKYVVVLPEKTIKKAGFKTGTKLKADAKKGEIKLRKKKLSNES